MYEGFNGGAPGTLKCVMYYTEWCPHCKDAKPEWDKFAAEYNGKTIDEKRILITKVDCDKNSELAKKEGVEGYPTFRFDFNNKDIPYKGERTYVDFKRFMESIVHTDFS